MEISNIKLWLHASSLSRHFFSKIYSNFLKKENLHLLISFYYLDFVRSCRVKTIDNYAMSLHTVAVFIRQLSRRRWIFFEILVFNCIVQEYQIEIYYMTLFTRQAHHTTLQIEYKFCIFKDIRWDGSETFSGVRVFSNLFVVPSFSRSQMSLWGGNQLDMFGIHVSVCDGSASIINAL